MASRRITSVLFGDLVGFTSLSETRDQEDVRELLSRYFEECATIVERYGGVVEKFIGDAVMAVWGVPTTNEDDAERSVRAGLELITAVAALGAEIGLDELAMRVGIVTGEVAVTIGAQMQGMVAGDPVNTASRVQSAAAPGQVWVDETTRLLTAAAISYADVGSHALKGKAEPMPLWAARAVIATAGGAQRADGLEAPLVGLDRELRMVKEAYHRCEESERAALLVVAGDAGTGKSRLGWEFSKYTDGLSTPCRWHAGRCVSYGEGVAYYALAEAVRSRLEAGCGLEEPPADIETLIDVGLAAYVASAEERAWLAPRLGALLGTSGAASFQRDDLYAAWTTFFERVSDGSEVVVMLVDDAHYADDGLLRFVEHLLAVASFPCFVVLLTRPELLAEHAELVTNRRSTVLHVDPLTDREMAGLVDGLVQGLPTTVRDELVRRAEGIPTYAVETVRALIDRDLVVPRGGAYVLADPDALDFDSIGAPTSLQALISARLDRLTSDERLVVDRASVAGDSVDPGVLAELCADIADLHRVLGDLVRAQILTVDHDRLSSEQGRYQFVQTAVRQVAYSTLSRRERKQAHLRVLQAQTGPGSEEQASVAAQHAVAAIEAAPDDPDVPDLTARAIALLRQAAARARSLGAPGEAAGHLRRAIELASDELVRPVLELDLARACHDAGHYDEALAHAGAARTAFHGLGDGDQEAEAAAVEADAVVRGPADYDAAVALLRPYYDELRQTRRRSRVFAVVLGSYQLAMVRAGIADMDLMAEALAVADLVGDRSMVARVLGNMSFLMARADNPILVDLFLEKSIEVAREAHDPLTMAVGLTNMSTGVLGADVPRALGLLDEAVDSTRRLGNVEWISLAHANRTLAHYLMGRWDDVEAAPGYELVQPDHAALVVAMAALVRAARGHDPAPTLAARGELRQQTSDYWHLADLLALWSDRDPATARRLDEVLDLAQRLYGVSDDFHMTYGVAVDIALALDDRELIGRLEQIVDQASTVPQEGLRGHRALLGAVTASRLGSDERAEGLFVEAVRCYDAWGSPVHAARGRAAYGAWLAGNGRTDEAAPMLDAARATYASLGAGAWLAELDDRLGGRPVRQPVGS
ncbi:MAG TPA: adenylate/guanylate cyclase domain-containing protein [Nocardioides sp.]|uniref:adenylate/guanylate cyclase domain-containing protein n=1 Tax=Nocardioides sp. TaxID=35761 RepID=UPI002E30C563|nr:adenylate/guanylate cyclase domain-containing protein [Nocardioides sp.]HEX3930718.1 adenylate/guanylate cyclase domain-containing protein [Nocardioides sp.]